MITIVTDSSAYFKKAEAAELGLRQVPICYTVNERPYFESYSDQNGDFEDLLRSSANLTTSHPNLSVFQSCFEEELAAGNQVLCITLSSRLSGAYGTANIAAKQTGREEAVGVLDSRLTGGGLYLLVKRAAQLSRNNLSLNGLISELTEFRERVGVVFSVDDMTPLRQSGRCGLVRMGVGTILNRKPVLQLHEGAVVYNGFARGETDLIKKLAHTVPPGASELVVNYLGNSRLATNLYGVLTDAHPNTVTAIGKLGPVMGIHLGLNAVGVSYVGK